jgi:hypothetical protein
MGFGTGPEPRVGRGVGETPNSSSMSNFGAMMSPVREDLSPQERITSKIIDAPFPRLYAFMEVSVGFRMYLFLQNLAFTGDQTV